MQIKSNNIPVYFTHIQNWVILRAFQYARCSASNLMTQLRHLFGASVSQLSALKILENLYLYIYFYLIFVGKNI